MKLERNTQGHSTYCSGSCWSFKLSLAWQDQSGRRLLLSAEGEKCSFTQVLELGFN